MTAHNIRRLGTLGLLAFAGALAVTPIAEAQTPSGTQMQSSFAAADTNHDGHISLPEFESYVEQRLANANGPRAQRFKAMTPQRQQAILQARFEKMDHGNKGYLDPSDWKAPT